MGFTLSLNLNIRRPTGRLTLAIVFSFSMQMSYKKLLVARDLAEVKSDRVAKYELNIPDKPLDRMLRFRAKVYKPKESPILLF